MSVELAPPETSPRITLGIGRDQRSSSNRHLVPLGFQAIRDTPHHKCGWSRDYLEDLCGRPSGRKDSQVAPDAYGILGTEVPHSYAVPTA